METASGGLIGLFRSFSSSARSTAKSGAGIFSKPEAWAVRLAALAGFVAIYVKSGAPTMGFEPVVFALAIGLSGLMFEATSAKNVMRSLWEGRVFGIAVWSLLWVCAFGYSAFNWISVAAENEAEKTNVHSAAAFKSADARSGVEMAAKAVLEKRQKSENLRKAAWDAIPVVAGQQITSEAQAQALIDKAKGNGKFWKATDECRDAQGPKARAFCDEYRSAMAAKADVLKRAEVQALYSASEDDVKKSEIALEDARKVASTTKVETKKGRADLKILAGMMNIAGDDAEDRVEQVAAIFKILAVSVFLSLGAAMMELEKLRAKGPRREFAFFRRIYLGFYKILTGKEAPAKPATYINVEDPRGAAALSHVERLQRGILSAASSYGPKTA